MHRIDTAGATLDNKFTDGMPSLGIPATVVDANILNALQEEIVYCIEQMQIVLQKGNNTQLWQAIVGLLNSHAQLTNPHGATSAAAANRLILRDVNGRAKIAAPSASDDIAIKQTIDDHATQPNAHGIGNATTSAKGIVELATNAEVATGTSTTLVPSVSAMVHHQGVAKSWINFNGTGTIAVRDSYNIAGITDNGVGDYTVTIDVDHASGDYVPLITTGPALGSPAYNQDYMPSLYAISAGAFSFLTADPSNNTRQDPELIVCATFGDR